MFKKICHLLEKPAYDNMSMPIGLSIIIVAYNVKDLMWKCLLHIKNSKDNIKKEIVFVDNGSSDGTINMIEKEFPGVKIIRSETNLGFIAANNLAYPKAKGKYILMLNSDAFIGENTLQKIFDFMEAHTEAGIVGCRLVDRDGKLQPSARRFPTPWRIFLTNTDIARIFPYSKFFGGIDNLQCPHDKIIETDWVPGCFLLIRKSIIDNFGYFLRKEFFMYCDDSDLCLRVKRKGWKIFFYPEDVVHLEGENIKRIARVTAMVTIIEKYKTESTLISFRKNYGFFITTQYFFFLELFDLLEIIKKLVLPYKNISLLYQLRHMVLVFNILRKTNFGARPISVLPERLVKR